MLASGVLAEKAGPCASAASDWAWYVLALMDVGDEARIAPRGTVQTRALDDGAVLVNLHSGACFELNSVGFEIWRALEQGRSISEICATLVARYGVDPGVIATDTRTLVGSLVEAGLVEIVRP